MTQTAERLELECSILGSAIRQSELLPQVVTGLTEEDFGHDVTRSIFLALHALFLRKSPVDRITVVQELGSDDYGEFITRCIELRIPPGNLPAYLQLLRERSRLDEIKDHAAAISLMENLREVSPALEAINTLMMTRRQWKGQSLADAVNAFCDRQTDETPVSFLATGFEKLDRELYVQPGDFVVLGGEPSSGKTMLATQFAVTLAKAGHRVGFFSLETSPEKLTDRIMAQQSQVPLASVKQKALTSEEWGAVSRTAQSLYSLPMDIIPASGMTVADIQAYALAQRYDVIFADYLQIIDGKSDSRYESVTKVSIGLHTLAQSHGIAVFALAQLSRPERQQKKDTRVKAPTMHDLRESGQVEQDADVVLLLYKDNPDGRYDLPRRLKIAKNKEGRLDTFDLAFHGATLTFTESEPDHWVYAEAANQKKNGELIRGKEKPAAPEDDTKFEQLSAFIKETF